MGRVGHHCVTKSVPVLITSRCLNGEVVSTAHILSIIRTFFPLCAVSFVGLDVKIHHITAYCDVITKFLLTPGNEWNLHTRGVKTVL